MGQRAVSGGASVNPPERERDPLYYTHTGEQTRWNAKEINRLQQDVREIRALLTRLLWAVVILLFTIMGGMVTWAFQLFAASGATSS